MHYDFINAARTKKGEGKKEKTSSNLLFKELNDFNKYFTKNCPDFELKFEPNLLTVENKVATYKRFINFDVFLRIEKTNTLSDYKKLVEAYQNQDSPETIEEFKSGKTFKIFEYNGISFEIQFALAKTYYGYPEVKAHALVTFPVKDEYFKLPKEVTGAENYDNVAKQLINIVVEGNNIPKLFELEEISYETDISGPVTLFDGTIFYIPKDLKKADRRIEFINNITHKFPANNLIYINIDSGRLVYSDSNGKISSINISGAAKITDEYIAKVFNSSISEVIDDGKKAGSLSNIWPTNTFNDLKDKNGNITYDFTQPLSSLDFASLKEKLTATKKYYIENRGNRSPVTYFEAMGRVTLLLRNIDKFPEIDARVKAKRENFEKHTAEDLPEIPYLREDLTFLPHQGEIAPKLAAAEENAIIDVGTGGGKTLIMLSDGLRLIGQGVKRPLYVVPKSLISQWVNQVNYFTDNSVNVFVLSTETHDNWGEKELFRAASNAPINTIFITSFSYLIKDSEVSIDEEKQKIYNFPIVNKILLDIRPGSLYIDEAHNIKNERTAKAEACKALRKIKYRRIGTGTLIGNTPTDLIGQVAVLDPNIIGSRKEFAVRYSASGKTGRGGGVTEWIPNVRDAIRNDLRNNSYYLLYREVDWAAALPSIEYKRHLIDLSPTQQTVYKYLVQQAIEEIEKDPNTAKQWAEFISDNTEQTTLSLQILGKLAKLEQYLTAPDSSEFIKFIKNESEKRSAKLDKIDELIGESISQGYKCIVAVHYKSAARHLLENSKYKDQGVYFDSSEKENIDKFNNDPNIKVIFAVAANLTEGHNLQIANRVIIADVDWTSGNLKQLMGRVYRPHLSKNEKGELVNLNADKKVYIDTVIANNSADTIKYMLQTTKKIFNSNIIEGSTVTVPTRPAINEESLAASSAEIGAEASFAADDEFNNWFFGAVEEKKKSGMGKLVPVKVAKTPEGSKNIKTPWVAGISVPTTKDGEGFKEVDLGEFLDKNFKTFKEAKAQLLNRAVKTEEGIGTIVNTRAAKSGKTPDNFISISFPSGEIKSFQVKDVKIFDGVLEQPTQDEIVTPPTLDTTTNTKDFLVNLNIISYNNILTIATDKNDADNEDLVAFGFRKQGTYYQHRINSKAEGKKVLDSIPKKYTIQNITVLQKAVNNLNKKPIIDIAADIKNFFKLSHTKSDSGKLKMYPMIENGILYFVYDKATNPGVTLKNFTEEKGFYSFFCKNKEVLKAKVDELTKAGYTISNPEAFNDDADYFGTGRLPESDTKEVTPAITPEITPETTPVTNQDILDKLGDYFKIKNAPFTIDDFSNYVFRLLPIKKFEVNYKIFNLEKSGNITLTKDANRQFFITKINNPKVTNETTPETIETPQEQAFNELQNNQVYLNIKKFSETKEGILNLAKFKAIYGYGKDIDQTLADLHNEGFIRLAKKKDPNQEDLKSEAFGRHLIEFKEVPKKNPGRRLGWRKAGEVAPTTEPVTPEPVAPTEELTPENFQDTPEIKKLISDIRKESIVEPYFALNVFKKAYNYGDYIGNINLIDILERLSRKGLFLLTYNERLDAYFIQHVKLDNPTPEELSLIEQVKTSRIEKEQIREEREEREKQAKLLKDNLTNFKNDGDNYFKDNLNLSKFKEKYNYNHEIDKELVKLHNEGFIKLAVKKDPNPNDIENSVKAGKKEYSLFIYNFNPKPLRGPKLIWNKEATPLTPTTEPVTPEPVAPTEEVKPIPTVEPVTTELLKLVDIYKKIHNYISLYLKIPESGMKKVTITISELQDYFGIDNFKDYVKQLAQKGLITLVTLPPNEITKKDKENFIISNGKIYHAFTLRRSKKHIPGIKDEGIIPEVMPTIEPVAPVTNMQETKDRLLNQILEFSKEIPGKPINIAKFKERYGYDRKINMPLVALHNKGNIRLAKKKDPNEKDLANVVKIGRGDFHLIVPQEVTPTEEVKPVVTPTVEPTPEVKPIPEIGEVNPTEEKDLLNNIKSFAKKKDEGATLNLAKFKQLYGYKTEIDEELVNLHNSGNIRLAVKKLPNPDDQEASVKAGTKEYHLFVYNPVPKRAPGRAIGWKKLKEELPEETIKEVINTPPEDTENIVKDIKEQTNIDVKPEELKEVADNTVLDKLVEFSKTVSGKLININSFKLEYGFGPEIDDELISLNKQKIIRLAPKKEPKLFDKRTAVYVGGKENHLIEILKKPTKTVKPETKITPEVKPETKVPEVKPVEVKPTGISENRLKDIENKLRDIHNLYSKNQDYDIPVTSDAWYRRSENPNYISNNGRIKYKNRINEELEELLKRGVIKLEKPANEKLVNKDWAFYINGKYYTKVYLNPPKEQTKTTTEVRPKNIEDKLRRFIKGNFDGDIRYPINASAWVNSGNSIAITSQLESLLHNGVIRLGKETNNPNDFKINNKFYKEIYLTEESISDDNLKNLPTPTPEVRPEVKPETKTGLPTKNQLLQELIDYEEKIIQGENTRPKGEVDISAFKRAKNYGKEIDKILHDLYEDGKLTFSGTQEPPKLGAIDGKFNSIRVFSAVRSFSGKLGELDNVLKPKKLEEMLREFHKEHVKDIYKPITIEQWAKAKMPMNISVPLQHLYATGNLNLQPAKPGDKYKLKIGNLYYSSILLVPRAGDKPKPEPIKTKFPGYTYEELQERANLGVKPEVVERMIRDYHSKYVGNYINPISALNWWKRKQPLNIVPQLQSLAVRGIIRPGKIATDESRAFKIGGKYYETIYLNPPGKNEPSPVITTPSPVITAPKEGTVTPKEFAKKEDLTKDSSPMKVLNNLRYYSDKFLGGDLTKPVTSAMWFRDLNPVVNRQLEQLLKSGYIHKLEKALESEKLHSFKINGEYYRGVYLSPRGFTPKEEPTVTPEEGAKQKIFLKVKSEEAISDSTFLTAILKYVKSINGNQYTVISFADLKKSIIADDFNFYIRSLAAKNMVNLVSFPLAERTKPVMDNAILYKANTYHGLRLRKPENEEVKPVTPTVTPTPTTEEPKERELSELEQLTPGPSVTEKYGPSINEDKLFDVLSDYAKIKKSNEINIADFKTEKKTGDIINDGLLRLEKKGKISLRSLSNPTFNDKLKAVGNKHLIIIIEDYIKSILNENSINYLIKREFAKGKHNAKNPLSVDKFKISNGIVLKDDIKKLNGILLDLDAAGKINLETDLKTKKLFINKIGNLSTESEETKQHTAKDVKNGVNEFLAFLNKKFGEKNRSYDMEEVNKYFKVTYDSYRQKSVYAFIAKDDFSTANLGLVKMGDILKAASWKAPAKKARGNIFDKKSWEKFGPYSPQYLR